MKIDANSDGAIDWEEFTSYMFLSKSSFANGQKNSTDVYMVLQPDVFSVNLNNVQNYIPPSENVVKIFLLEETYELFTITNEGLIRVWNPNTLQLQTTYSCYQSVTSKSRINAVTDLFNFKKSSRVTDMCYLERSNRIAVSSTGNGVVFLDKHSDSSRIISYIDPTSLRYSLPLCISNTFLKAKNEEIFTVGTKEGYLFVYRMTEAYWKIENKTLLYVSSVVYLVHTNHLTKAEYVKELNCVVSCSHDTTINLLDIERENNKKRFKQHKKPVYYFVWCPRVKLIASCGVESDILLWSPFSLGSTAVLKGHYSSVTKLSVVTKSSFLISISKTNNLIVWDLKSLTELQRISLKPFSLVRKKEVKNVNLLCTINPATNCVILWNHQLILIPPIPNLAKIAADKSVGTSHRFPLIGGFYNDIFNQVLTVCMTGQVSVWNVDTTERLKTFKTSKHDKTPRYKFIRNFQQQDKIYNVLEQTIWQAEREESEKIDFSRISITFCFDTNKKRLITSGAEGSSVKVWNFSNGTLILSLNLPTIESTMLDIPNKLLGASDKKEVTCLTYIITGFNLAISYSARQKYFVAGLTLGKIVFWEDNSDSDLERKSNFCLPKALAHKKNYSCLSAIQALAFLLPYTIVSANVKGDICFWNLTTGELRGKCRLENKPMFIQVLSSCQMLLVLQSKGLSLVCSRLFKLLLKVEYQLDNDEFCCFTVSTTQDLVVIGSNQGIIHWLNLLPSTKAHREPPSVLASFQVCSNAVRNVSLVENTFNFGVKVLFSTDKTIYLSSSDGTLEKKFIFPTEAQFKRVVFTELLTPRVDSYSVNRCIRTRQVIARQQELLHLMPNDVIVGKLVSTNKIIKVFCVTSIKMDYVQGIYGYESDTTFVKPLDEVKLHIQNFKTTRISTFSKEKNLSKILKKVYYSKEAENYIKLISFVWKQTGNTISWKGIDTKGDIHSIPQNEPLFCDQYLLKKLKAADDLKQFSKVFVSQDVNEECISSENISKENTSTKSVAAVEENTKDDTIYQLNLARSQESKVGNLRISPRKIHALDSFKT